MLLSLYGEFHVNTRTSFDQGESANASAANGRSVAVWLRQPGFPLAFLDDAILFEPGGGELERPDRSSVGFELGLAPAELFLGNRPTGTEESRRLDLALREFHFGFSLRDLGTGFCQ